MTNEGDNSVLRSKILSSQAKSDEDIGGQCLQKALELYDKNGGGTMYWVGKLDQVGIDAGLHHTYYVPPNAQDSDNALNQADNGYAQYPALTVEETKKLGDVQNPDVVRALVESGKRR